MFWMIFLQNICIANIFPFLKLKLILYMQYSVCSYFLTLDYYTICDRKYEILILLLDLFNSTNIYRFL